MDSLPPGVRVERPGPRGGYRGGPADVDGLQVAIEIDDLAAGRSVLGRLADGVLGRAHPRIQHLEIRAGTLRIRRGSGGRTTLQRAAVRAIALRADDAMLAEVIDPDAERGPIEVVARHAAGPPTPIFGGIQSLDHARAIARIVHAELGDEVALELP